MVLGISRIQSFRSDYIIYNSRYIQLPALLLKIGLDTNNITNLPSFNITSPRLFKIFFKNSLQPLPNLIDDNS